MEFAVAEGHRHSVQVTGHLIEAAEVDGVISFLRTNRADLLVVGLRQHSTYVAQLWSTVSSMEQQAPCSVLAVHAPRGRAAESDVSHKSLAPIPPADSNRREQ
jgi:hypothetical protein